MFSRSTRRHLIESCIGRGLLVAAVPMAAPTLASLWAEGEDRARKPTPTEVLGPFYKKGAPNVSALRVAGEPGFPLHVGGKLINTQGEPVPGGRVDIWQTDYRGRYDLQGYRYRARLVTPASGEYAVETIMPGHYDDRPAQHIHYMISAPGHRTLITQIYFATDPWFEGDPDKNFRKHGIVGNRELIRTVKLYEQPDAVHASVDFDICLEKA